MSKSVYKKLVQNCIALLKLNDIETNNIEKYDDLDSVESINSKIVQLLKGNLTQPNQDLPDTKVRKLIKTLLNLANNFEKESLEKIFERFFELLGKIIDFENGTIFLFDEENGKLIPVISTSKVVDLISAVNFSFGNGFTPWIAKIKKSILLSNINSSKPGKEFVHSFLSVPVLEEGRVIGVINLSHSRSYAFDETNVEILTIVSSQIIGALISFRRLSKLKNVNKELEVQLKKFKDNQEKLIQNERFASVVNTVVSINHEINNPLCSLSGRLQLLKSKIDSENNINNENISEDYQIMLKDINRITSLLQKMQNITKPVFTDYIPGVKMLDIERSISC